MGNRVDRVKTEVSEAQMAQGIIEAWKDLFGNTPTKEQVAIILSQNALETGNRKSMWNFNIGNITTNGKDAFDFFDDLTTKEQVQPGVWKSMNLKYRAYPTLKDGVKDYLKLLSSKHYSSAWQHIIDPDPAEFSKSLKQSGYYTANEAPYTKSLTRLYNQFSNSNGYEDAVNGKVAPVASQQVATNKAPVDDMDNILNRYLQEIAASEKYNKQLYKKYLPQHQLVIRVNAANYTEAVEFSRILSFALGEDLLANAFVHTDGECVDVQCQIRGPQEDCFKAVEQLTNIIAKTFTVATKKVGGYKITTQFVMNKKSSYQPISLEASLSQHKKFLLKFI